MLGKPCKHASVTTNLLALNSRSRGGRLACRPKFAVVLEMLGRPQLVPSRENRLRH